MLRYDFFFFVRGMRQSLISCLFLVFISNNSTTNRAALLRLRVRVRCEWYNWNGSDRVTASFVASCTISDRTTISAKILPAVVRSWDARNLTVLLVSLILEQRRKTHPNRFSLPNGQRRWRTRSMHRQHGVLAGRIQWTRSHACLSRVTSILKTHLFLNRSHQLRLAHTPQLSVFYLLRIIAIEGQIE